MNHTDSESRRLIATDFEHTLFVDAGAGSGKTTSMVSRIMVIILKGLADVREIAAITFTNEGAASLKSKMQTELESAHGSDSYTPTESVSFALGKQEHARIETALTNLPLAQFSTIHSFCLSMLKERPVEAGIDPKFEMNTEGNVISAFGEAWAKFIVEAARQRHAFLGFIAEEGIDLEEVRRIAEIKYQNPDLTLYTENVKRVSEAEVNDAFKRVLELSQMMWSGNKVLIADRRTQAGEDRVQFVKDLYWRAASCKTRREKLKLITGTELHKKWTQNQTMFERAVTELGEIQGSIGKRHLDFLHSHIVEFVAAFESYFALQRKNTSTLEFQDLLYLACSMLKESRNVRQYFKRKYMYLFVDEAQDVDPLQTEVVFLLAEKPDLFARHWKEVSLEPSKLFVVGDPKQSIYKFRRADIAMYEEAKAHVKSQGGLILSLTKNFRSASPIIHFVNDHFAGSFQEFVQDRELDLQPEYAPLEPAAGHQSHLGSHVVSLVPNAGANKRDTLASETKKLVGFIRETLDNVSIADSATGDMRPLRYSDIMVLMKAFTDIDVYTGAFEDAGIPYQEVGGRTFFHTDDVRGLVFALKAIDDPTDTVSLFGALKSPVIGISDQALFDFVSAGNRFTIFGGEEPGADTLNLALVLFRNLHHRRETLRPSGVLKELFDASGICHIVVSEPNGVQKSSKYFRLLELVYEIEGDQRLSFRAVVAALESVMKLDDPQLANVTITHAGQNAVKITTIHRAKGLEAPVIVIANSTVPNTRRDITPSHIVLRDKGMIVIPYQKSGGLYSLDADKLRAFEERREYCEAERLRYVAATRARDLLAVCVQDESVGGETFNGRFAPSLSGKAWSQSASRKVEQERAPAGPPRITASEAFAEAKAKRAERLQLLQEKLAALQSPFLSVHDTMEIDPGLFRMKRKARGKGYGNVIHRAMQQIVTNTQFDIMSVLDQWMEDENVPHRFRGDVLASLTRLGKNPHVQEAVACKEKYCEWDFYVKQDGAILNGVIDLVYRRAAGDWVIVDYKTDDVSDPDRKRRLDGTYGRQLAEYQKAFETVTGFHVGESALLYSDMAEVGTTMVLHP